MENKGNKSKIAVTLAGTLAFSICLFVQSKVSHEITGIISQIELVISIAMVLFGRKYGVATGCLLNGATALYILFAKVIADGDTAASARAFVSMIAIGIVLLINFYISKNERMNNELTESYQQAIENNRIIEEQGETLKYLAYYDRLTQLPNRHLFLENLEDQIKKNGDCVVIYVDLDDFRRINDGYGHTTGDELLKRYAQKIETYCGEDIFAAKVGGDEFGIILGSGRTEEAIYQFATGLCKVLSEPVNIGGDVYTVAASCGAATFPEHAMTAEDLFRCAEKAMYNAKASGKNQVCFYTKHADKKSDLFER